jgi:two-component system chemotaxis response regulator CheB
MSNHDLIAIGGSAGSIEPLKVILAQLPADLPAAVLIVIHVPATSTGIFTTVAAASCAMPVKSAEDGDLIVNGKVYLAPPDHHLLIVKDRLRLGRGPRENLVRPSIDPLMRSAALFYGSRTIGVILSGLMNDGASGLATIKRAGGIALVQAPIEAASRDMPIAALEATTVDRSGSAAELVSAIMQYVGEPPGKPKPLPADVRVEVEIAAGRNIDTTVIREIADVAPLTCPDCGGVLSQMKDAQPIRFRCQVGHAYTAQTLQDTQENAVDEAVRVALRIIEERAELVSRMAKDARAADRWSMAEMHEGRAKEYRDYANILRKAVISSLESREWDAEDKAAAEILDFEKRSVRED